MTTIEVPFLIIYHPFTILFNIAALFIYFWSFVQGKETKVVNTTSTYGHFRRIHGGNVRKQLSTDTQRVISALIWSRGLNVGPTFVS